LLFKASAYIQCAVFLYNELSGLRCGLIMGHVPEQVTMTSVITKFTC